MKFLILNTGKYSKTRQINNSSIKPRFYNLFFVDLRFFYKLWTWNCSASSVNLSKSNFTIARQLVQNTYNQRRFGLQILVFWFLIGDFWLGKPFLISKHRRANPLSFVCLKLDFYCLCSLQKSSSKIKFKNQFREIDILENQMQIIL